MLQSFSFLFHENTDFLQQLDVIEVLNEINTSCDHFLTNLGKVFNNLEPIGKNVSF